MSASPNKSQPGSTRDAFDLENLIMDARGCVAVMRHLMHGMEDGEDIAWLLPIDRLDEIVGKVQGAFDAEWDAQQTVSRGFQAELARLKAEKAAPGSKEDREQADAGWLLLRSAATVMLQQYDERNAPPKPSTAAQETAGQPTASASLDAELIDLCEAVVDVDAKQQALFSVRHTVEEEERTQPLMDGLYAEWGQLVDDIAELPPAHTNEGRAALARAALAIAERDRAGNLMPRTKGERLTWCIVRSLAIAEGFTDHWVDKK